MSIRMKLMVLFLLLALIPMTFIAFLSYQQERATIEDNVGKGLEVLSEQTIDAIDHALLSHKADLKTWAAAEVMQDVITDDADGRISATLSRFKQQSGAYSSIYCINLDGAIIASSEASAIGRKVSDSSWFQDAMRSSGTSIRDLAYDPLIDDFAVIFSTPIVAVFEEHAVIGILSSRLRQGRLSDIVRHIRILGKDQGESAYAVLINRQGEVIVGPRFRDAGGMPHVHADMGLNDFESVRLACQGQRGSMKERSATGVEYLLGFAPSQRHGSSTGLGWAVVILQEAREAFAPVKSLRNRFVSLSLVVACVVLLLAFWISLDFSRPLLQLSESASEIAKGNLSHRVKIHSRDELGVLGASFNAMAENLEKSHADLVATREHLATTLHSIGDAVIATDTMGLVTFINPIAADLVGRSEQDVLGRPLGGILRIIHEETRQDVESPVGKVLRDRALVGLADHTVLLSHSGREIPIADTASPIYDKQGDITGVVLVFRDVTDKRRYEQGLIQAKEAAETANIAKSDFLANMSHELRTPMNGIISMANLLLDMNLSLEQKEFITLIKSCSDDLMAIINDILDLSKIEAGKFAVSLMPLNLHVLVEDVADKLAAKAEKARISLVIRYNPKAPSRFMADPSRIRQILVNLLGNAIKFSEKGRVIIDIDCESQDAEGAVMCFKVLDTGIGIPAHKLESIFEKFTQVDTSTTRRFGGTGLGLAICKQLVELMGGRIGVESREGEGSTFYFRLPLQFDPAPSDMDPPRATLHGVRVLTVGGTELTRGILHAELTHAGMQTRGCASGEEALNLLDEAHAADHPYHIVLIDEKISGMDVGALACGIQARESLKDTSLVLIASRAWHGDAGKLPEMGFAAYLLKPLGQFQLLETLKLLWADRTCKKPRPLITRRIFTSSPSGERFSDPPAESPPFERAKILLVEDEAVNQKVAVNLVRNLGCRISIADNGEDALKMLASDSYDLVLMDCQMPIMDGYEATRRIRQSEAAYRNIPVIALTAHAMPGDRETCLDNGMNDYLSKPIDQDILHAILRKYLPDAMARSGPEMPQDAPAQQAIDFDRLHKTSQGDKVFEHELIALYLKDVASKMERIGRAIEEEDADTLRKTGHGLKGISLTMGAAGLSAVGLELQILGETNNMGKAQETFNTLKAEFEQVKIALRRHMAEEA